VFALTVRQSNFYAHTISKTLTTTAGEPLTKEEELMKNAKKKKVLLSDPAAELNDAQEALAMFKDNLRAATKELSKSGLMVKTQIADSHGKFTTVQRINPMLKVQREALRAIGMLKRQIAELQKEVQASEKPLTALDILAAMKKEKHESD
jgi:hypothetical protein